MATAPSKIVEKPWCVWEVFQRLEEADPSFVALVDQRIEVTRAELRQRAEELDRLLRHLGVGRGSPVMLANECNTFALVAALAIIRIGAVFIPGDSAVPPEKRAEFVEMAEVTHLICERPVPGLPESVTVICEETMQNAPANEPLAPAAEWLASEMACVFFSSGSTGLPKGVRHSAVFWFELVGIQYFDAATEARTIESPRRPVTWCDGFWHGSATWYSNWGLISDVFNALCVVAVTKDVLLDSLMLQELRIKHGYKQMYFPPAHLRTILATEPGALSDLDFIYVWGEKMNEDMVNEAGRQYPKLDLLDWLGTSETFLGIHRRFTASDGIQSAHWRADRDTEVYIVDPDDYTKKITSPYTPGEMCFVRPPGVTFCLGYLGNDEMSKQKFVPNPFGPGMMFRIGDVAQWVEEPKGLPDRVRTTRGLDQPVETMADGWLQAEKSCCRVAGTAVILEVLGRNDDQIKVRGQMVNLVEVDTKANAIEFVKLAGCKSLVTPAGETEIALYCEMSDPSRIVELRPALMKVMESFTVPAYIEVIEKLPYNANGKLVRRQLPTPEMKADQLTEFTTDDPSVEAQVLCIMRNLVDAEITMESNFLMAGGHSLLAVQVLNQFRKNNFIDVRMKVPELYANADLAKLVEFIEQRKIAGPGTDTAITPRGGDAALPVPAAGFNVSCMVRGPKELQSFQTVSMAVWIEGALDPAWLRKCLEIVHARHEALRSRYATDDAGKRYLVVTPAEAFPLPLLEVDYSDKPHKEAKRLTNALFEQDACYEPFDPFGEQPFDEVKRQGPLAHFYLVKTAAQEHCFFYGMHHAIADGYSDTVFWREINESYYALGKGEGVDPVLPELTVQYTDFALWQIETLYQEERVSRGFEKMAQLYMADGVGWAAPPDKKGVPCESTVRHACWYRGGPWTEASLEFSVCENLQKIAQANGATLFMAVIAVYHIWQHKQTQAEELGLGVTLYGRHHAQVENLIGNFQQSGCVRTNVAGCRTFLDVLARVKKSFLEMMDLADSSCFDHASWSDIFEGYSLEDLPKEVRNYMVGRPKAYLNFEEFDYGAASTQGFIKSGLTAKNQVAPVDPDEYHADDDVSDAPPEGVPPALEGGGAEAEPEPEAATGEDFGGASEVYYYPNAVDCRIPAGEKHGGNFGTRVSNAALAKLRDIDDYEVYFAFSMSSRTADDIGGWTEDYIYMAYDDQLYEKETARAMIGSLVETLMQCSEHPEQVIELPPSAEVVGGRDELGRSQLGSEATAFVNQALAGWRERLKAQAGEFRAKQ